MRGWLAKLIAGPHWPSVGSSTPVPAPTPAPWYSSVSDGELRLGEIITGLVSYRFRAVPDGVEVEGITHPYVLVATPECDLLQSFKDMRAGRPLKISNILFFEVEEAAVVRKRVPIPSKVWPIVTSNRMDGLHHLTEFSAASDLQGRKIPDLLIDFKRHFTLPVDEVYRQLGLKDGSVALRRCFPGDLWREKIQQRALASMGRVGTPAPEDEIR